MDLPDKQSPKSPKAVSPFHHQSTHAGDTEASTSFEKRSFPEKEDSEGYSMNIDSVLLPGQSEPSVPEDSDQICCSETTENLEEISPKKRKIDEEPAQDNPHDREVLSPVKAKSVDESSGNAQEVRRESPGTPHESEESFLYELQKGEQPLSEYSQEVGQASSSYPQRSREPFPYELQRGEQPSSEYQQEVGLAYPRDPQGIKEPFMYELQRGEQPLSEYSQEVGQVSPSDPKGSGKPSLDKLQGGEQPLPEYSQTVGQVSSSDPQGSGKPSLDKLQRSEQLLSDDTQDVPQTTPAEPQYSEKPPLDGLKQGEQPPDDTHEVSRTSTAEPQYTGEPSLDWLQESEQSLSDYLQEVGQASPAEPHYSGDPLLYGQQEDDQSLRDDTQEVPQASLAEPHYSGEPPLYRLQDDEQPLPDDTQEVPHASLAESQYRGDPPPYGVQGDEQPLVDEPQNAQALNQPLVIGENNPSQERDSDFSDSSDSELAEVRARLNVDCRNEWMSVIRLYECEHCEILYKDSFLYDLHMQAHHFDSTSCCPFICWCRETAHFHDDKYGFNLHLYHTEHGPLPALPVHDLGPPHFGRAPIISLSRRENWRTTDEIWGCKLCHILYRDYYIYRLHTRAHFYNFTCVCAFTTERAEEFNMHLYMFSHRDVYL